jgi:lipopolysaccharide/colanic/teichoic acid biosynthesis glycosyltransferase
VLAGQMSLVGPRPLPLDETRALHGGHRRRLAMRPGITCTWQVSGRSQVTFAEWMTLDLEYVDGWSLGLDLAIMVRTIPAVLSARGAH